MNLQRSALATAVTAALAMGLSGQAAADVYAGSSLHVDDLNIAFLDANNAPAFGAVTLNSFNFTTTNTASINGSLSGGTATCGTGNACGAGTPGNPVLDGPVANAPGTAFNRVNNQTSGDGTLTWFGFNTASNWSNADSVVYTSELTSALATPTHTDMIAQSNISSATSASANSEILSTSGFTFNFTVGSDPVNFSLAFLADPDMIAGIMNDLGSAQSTMAVSLTLQKDGTGGFGQPALQGASWAPDGSSNLGAGNCFGAGSVNCTELTDTESLNQTIGTSTNNTTAENGLSFGPNVGGLVSYSVYASGLTAGDWTLSLKAQVSTNLTRIQQVPEPGMLALMGIGLAGLGIATRRRKA